MDTVKGRLSGSEMVSQWQLNVKRRALVWFRHGSGDWSETVNSSSFLWTLSLRAPKCYVIMILSRCHLFLLLCFLFFMSSSPRLSSMCSQPTCLLLIASCTALGLMLISCVTVATSFKWQHIVEQPKWITWFKRSRSEAATNQHT